MEAVFYEHVVQYYETDRMGCVHHSNYIRWFEEARTWLMAEGGFGYDRMEALGVMSPVLKAGAEYRTMARFGETVVIETRVEQYTGTRIAFSYAVRDKATGALRCQGRTEHCFINEKGLPRLPPGGGGRGIRGLRAARPCPSGPFLLEKGRLFSDFPNAALTAPGKIR